MRFECLNRCRIALLYKLGDHIICSVLLGQQVFKLAQNPVKNDRINFLRLTLKLRKDFDNSFHLFCPPILNLKWSILEIFYKLLLDLFNTADFVAKYDLSGKLLP